MTRVLIIEDEPRLVSFLERGLRSNGWTVASVGTGLGGERLARSANFDLILVDLGLPDIDGIDVVRDLRSARCKAPIIILTAREDVKDKINALDAGANDYVTKPFSFDELLARIRVQLRVGNSEEATILTADTLTLDLRTRRAHVNGAVVELTAREFTMLEVFMRHRQQVLSREQLLSQVWGYGYDPGSNIVDVHIARLRRKLGPDTIRTMRGMGYSIE